MALTNDELMVLEKIRSGYTQMAEIMDFTMWGGERTNKVIESLDKGGYILRTGLNGARFWEFLITQKGIDCLPPLSDEDEKLAHYGLCSFDVKVLEAVQSEKKGKTGDILSKHFDKEKDGLEAALSVSKMVRRGYLNDSGFFQQKIELSDKGKEILKA